MSVEIRGRVCGASYADIPDGQLLVEVLIPREHAERIGMSMPVTITIPEEA